MLYLRRLVGNIGQMAIEHVAVQPIRGFLLDITGVLYNSAQGTDGVAIPGSIEAVQKLYEKSRVRFLSNESTNTTKHIVDKLGRLGFRINVEDVITPASIAVDFIRKNGLRPFTLVAHGVSSYFDSLQAPNPNCVVIGDAEDEFTYDNMNSAFKALLKMSDPLIISLGNGKFYQRTDGLCLDVGAYAAALKFSTNSRHIVIGKPSPEYFQTGIDSLGLQKEEVVMIGDDIVGDVGGGLEFGLAMGVQVRTGKWRTEWEQHETVKPTFIANNLKEAVDRLLSEN